MTKNWDIFPKEQPYGEDLANFSCYKIYEKSAIAGYGVLSGCAVSRTSATEVAVASGTFTVAGVKKTFAGGSLTGITAAASGKHRYDLVYIDGADDTLKLASGTEATPTSGTDFLENYIPRPAVPTDTDWVCLAVIRVTESGIENTNFGTNSYATGSIANMRLGPSFGVDDTTLQVVDGVISAKGLYVFGPVRITHDGGASQAIITTPALCEIDRVVVKCAEASATRTVDIGWSGDTDALMANSEVPKTLNGVTVNRDPTSEITSATNVIATVGGSGTTGEWDVWLRISRFT